MTLLNITQNTGCVPLADTYPKHFGGTLRHNDDVT